MLLDGLFLDSPSCSWMVLDAAVCTLMYLDAPEYFWMHQDAPKFSYILLLITPLHVIPPLKSYTHSILNFALLILLHPTQICTLLHALACSSVYFCMFLCVYLLSCMLLPASVTFCTLNSWWGHKDINSSLLSHLHKKSYSCHAMV